MWERPPDPEQALRRTFARKLLFAAPIFVAFVVLARMLMMTTLPFCPAH
jgi:hypothetical protein